MARTKQTARKPKVEKVAPLTVNQKKLLRLKKGAEKKYLKKYNEYQEWDKRCEALAWMERNQVENAYFEQVVDPKLFKQWIKDHFDVDGVIDGSAFPAFVRMIEAAKRLSNE